LRAIGVVYRPQSEFLSHYFEAVLGLSLESTSSTIVFGGRRHSSVMASQIGSCGSTASASCNPAAEISS
jgi:hypothetical protein